MPASNNRLTQAASLVIVVAGLKLGSQVLIPLLISSFLAVICLPPVRKLQSKGLPEAPAILLVVIFVLMMLSALGWLVGGSAEEFAVVLPEYQARFEGLFVSVTTFLQTRGIAIEASAIVSQLDQPIIGLLGDTARGLAAAVSNILLVVLVTLFILFEADEFPGKFRKAFGEQPEGLSRFRDFSADIQTYLEVKTLLSAFTGLLIGVGLWLLGVDFALLLGVMAFLLNFIPTIGSIIAAIPAVLLALIDTSLGTTAMVGLLYGGVNLSVGQLLEPQMMGRSLGLSPLVVFLSLLLWGWIWGPVGMLLSVPLTMVFKISLEHTEQYRWVAVLLSAGVTDKRQKTAVS